MFYADLIASAPTRLKGNTTVLHKALHFSTPGKTIAAHLASGSDYVASRIATWGITAIIYAEDVATTPESLNFSSRYQQEMERVSRPHLLPTKRGLNSRPWRRWST